MKRIDFRAILILTVSGMGLFSGQVFAQQPNQGVAPVAPAGPAVPLPNFGPGGFNQFGDSDPGNHFRIDPAREQQRSELAELDARTQKLAAELRAKPDAARELELKKMVEEYFDKRHAAQVAEMKALAEKLAKMQEILKKREQKKDEILVRRIKQLLGENDDLDWEPSSPRGNQFHYGSWGNGGGWGGGSFGSSSFGKPQPRANEFNQIDRHRP